MRITVGNLKGGTAKTTTAVYLACALAERGRTALIDADPQGSALDWSVHAEAFPATVIPWPLRDLAKRVGQIAGDYEHLVIDTGPEHDVILRQALLCTDELVIPVAPSPMELRRLSATVDLAAEIDAISPVAVSVLLAKVRANTRSAGEARQMLTDMGMPVLTASTHLWESYLLAWGTTPTDLGEYRAVLDELVDGGDTTREQEADA